MGSLQAAGHYLPAQAALAEDLPRLGYQQPPHPQEPERWPSSNKWASVAVKIFIRFLGLRWSCFLKGCRNDTCESFKYLVSAEGAWH